MEKIIGRREVIIKIQKRARRRKANIKLENKPCKYENNLERLEEDLRYL